MSKVQRKNQQRGISPIVATVMIVAVTLVAGVAIGGYIFGLFGSQTAVAQIVVSLSSLNSNSTAPNAAAAALNILSFRCSATSTGLGRITLSNSGAVNGTISTISLTYGATSYSNTTNFAEFTTAAIAGASRNCHVVPSAGTTNIYLTKLPKAVSSGNTYVGEVVLSDGTRIPFTGTFK